MRRVLFIGAEVSGFYNEVAEALRDANVGEVDLYETRFERKEIPVELRSVYSRVIKPVRRGFRELELRSILPALVHLCRRRRSVRYCGVVPWIREAIVAPRLDHLLGSYDLYHFHLLLPDCLRYLRYVPRGTKVICSFWGSDLYLDRSQWFRAQERAFRHADVVTVSTPEMRDFFVAKFGSKHAEKIVIQRIGVKDEVFDSLDSVPREEALRAVCADHDLAVGRQIVTLGYCANEVCNHIPALNALRQIDDKLKERCTIVVPMTYGGSKDYVESVKRVGAQTDLEIRYLESFLSVSELAALRRATDIYIHVNATDALSASFCEALYSGSHCVVGSWLPYSTLDEAHVRFTKVERIQDVADAVAGILEMGGSRPGFRENRAPVRRLFSRNLLAGEWVDLVRGLLDGD